MVMMPPPRSRVVNGRTNATMRPSSISSTRLARAAVPGSWVTSTTVLPNARKISRISYEEMLELSSLGAKVLQIRSVELAMKHRMPLHVRSSFSNAEGTIVTDEEHLLEKVIVAGVAADKKTVKLTVRALPDHPGVVASVFEPLAEANISVDMIIQNVSREGHTDLTFTVSREDADRAEEIAKEIVASVNAEGVGRDDSVAKVSIVGVGMRNHAGIAALTLGALGPGCAAGTRVRIDARHDISGLRTWNWLPPLPLDTVRR